MYIGRKAVKKKREIHHIFGAFGAENVVNFFLFLYKSTL